MYGPGTRAWAQRPDTSGSARSHSHVSPGPTRHPRRHGHCGVHPVFWIAGILVVTGAAAAAMIVLAVAGALVAGGWALSYLASPAVRDRVRVPSRRSDPWRALDQRVTQAQKRYRAATQAAPDGPVRGRLADLGRRVEASVKEARRMGRRGRELEALVASGGPDEAGSQRLIDDLRAQLTERVEGLEAAASVAVELTLRAELDRMNGDTGDVAADLSRVRDALERLSK